MWLETKESTTLAVSSQVKQANDRTEGKTCWKEGSYVVLPSADCHNKCEGIQRAWFCLYNETVFTMFPIYLFLYAHMSFLIHSFINSRSHKCSSSPTVSQTAHAAGSYQGGKCTFVLWRFLSSRGGDRNDHRRTWLPLHPGSAVSNPGGCAVSDSIPLLSVLKDRTIKLAGRKCQPSPRLYQT